MARKAAKKHPEILRYEELEQRLLFSADLLPGVDVDTDALDRTAVYQDVAETAPTDAAAVENAAQVEEVRHELVFVNENVADYEQLIADLQGDENRTIEVVVLDAARNGIEQVSEILAERTNLSAIHFITHGSDGQINIGDGWLNSTTLAENSDAVASWGNSLTETGDILFYGCNLAETEVGQNLTETLAELTSADVAASDDMTGHADLGADWELEYESGLIESSALLSEQTTAVWDNVLATLTVTTTNDVVDGTTTSITDLLNNKGADDFISLREAIIAANNTDGADEILLGTGTYTLSIAGAGDDLAATGDLDIFGDVTITGAGINNTIIDGADLDRVFHVLSGTVNFSDLTIQNGLTSDKGGGINIETGTTTFQNVLVTSNESGDQGGGIFQIAGTLNIIDSTIDNNIGAEGGGLIAKAIANLTGVTISNNQATADGGGIYTTGGTALTATNVTISGNIATGKGGAIYNSQTTTFQNVTITNNTAATAGGIHNSSTGSVILRNTIVAGNNSTTGADLVGTSKMTSLGTNLIDGVDPADLADFGASDILNIAPTLGVLADNGGLTLTHALLTGSRGIDEGSNTGAPATDQRDVLRDGSCDIGAYELEVNVAPTDLQVTTTTEGGTNLNDDGGNDAYFVADYGGVLLGGLTTVTIEATFSITSPVSTYAPILSYADGANDEELAILINADGSIRFGACSNGTPLQDTVEAYAQLLDGEIHHLGVSWDSSTGAVDFYIDGALVESFTGYQTGLTTTGGGELVFGQEQDSELGAFNTNEVFSGTLYDVRIFDDVRTAGEIASNYDQALPSNETNMIANWTFGDLSTGGVVTEAVSGLYNLTLQHVVGAGFTASNPVLTLSLPENSANGTVIGNLSTIDPNSGDTFNYTLTDNAGGRFDINSSTGEIFVLDSTLIDFETLSSHNITVEVTDGGGLTYNEIFTIPITDVNDAPVATADPGDYNATITALNPLGYWQLNQTTNTIAVDYGSADNSGTYIGPTLGVAGAINGSSNTAVDFNRAESDYIEIDHDDAYLLDNGTVQLWFNADDLTADQALISKDSTDFDTGGHFYIELLTSGEISVRLQSTTAEYTIVTSGAGITISSWHHVALTFGDQGIQLYLDGELVGSNSYTGGLGTTSGGIGNYEPLVIGANNDASGDLVATPLRSFFDGKIDEVALLGSQISAQQVKELYGAALQHYTLAENTTTNISATEGVLANDFDADGDALTAVLVSDPSHAASFTLNADGSFDYTPTAGFDGTDSFTYLTNDGTSDSNSATVTLTITGINDAPNAVSDRPSLNFDGVDDYVQIANDSSLIMSDTMTMEAWINPSGLGTGSQLILNKEGEYELGIIADTGQIIVAITKSDNTWTWHYTGQFVTLGEWSHVAVTYDSAAGEAKTYINGSLVDTYSQLGSIGDVYTLENELTIGGRQNDTAERFDGQIADVRVWNTVRSQVEINANQNATLTGSEAGLVGSWLLNDGSSTVADNSVLDGIDGQLSAGLPTWNDFTVDEDGTLTVSVPGILINDFDADGDTLTAALVSDVSNGTLALSNDGSFVYTPHADFNGVDSFTYIANDGALDSNVATVTITVNPVNDAPELLTGAVNALTINEDSGLTSLGLGTVTYGPGGGADESSQSLTYEVTVIPDPTTFGKIFLADGTTQVTTGTYTLTDLQGMQFAPNANESGNSFFTFNVQDDGGTANSGADLLSQSIEITVTPVNDAPTLSGANDLSAINEDDFTNSATLVSALIAGQVSDADTGSMEGIAVVAVDDSNGTWEYTTDGSNWLAFGAVDTSAARLLAADATTSVRFVPDADYNGTVTDGITFHAWDQTGGINGGTAALATNFTLRDEFNTASFNNDDGTAAWASDWIESDTDGPGAALGNITISDDQLQLVITPTNAGDWIYRQADLTDADVATLSFDYLNNLSGIKRIDLEISDDGGFTFTALATFTGSVNIGSGSFSADISSYISSNTQIRFYFTASSLGFHSLSVDNVQILYSANEDIGGSTAFSTDSASSSIIVMPVNDAPVITSSATVNAAENQTAVTTVTATDADLDVPTFSISGGADQALFSLTAGGVLSFNAAQDFETFADANSDGVYEVQVTADDGNLGTAVQTILVTLTDVNEAPTLVSLSNSSLDENTDTSGGTTIGSLTTSDVDAGDTTSYSITGGADAGLFSLSGSDLILTDGVLDFESQASYEVTVRVTDSGGLTHDQTFTITVNDLNEAPTFDSAAVTTATEDVEYSYTISTSDVDGDALTIDATTLPTWLTLTDHTDGTATLSGTPTNADVGDHAVVLTVSDGTLLDSQSFTITCSNTNDAPTVDNAIADQVATEDTPFSFQFASDVFGDVDAGDTLTYTSDASGWLSFDAATRTFSGTPLNADVGTTTVTVTANDGNGGTITDTFDIVISNTNDAPTVDNAIADQTATEDSLFSFQFAADVFGDVDAGDTLTYTSNASGWMSFDAATRTFSGTPLNADIGTTTVTVTADDGHGGTVSDSFDIVISNSNDAPTVATPIADQTATEDSAFTFTFDANTFADVDAGDSLTYTSDASGWLSFDAATRTFSGTPLNADVGTTTVTVTAVDGNGGTVSDTFDIVISNSNDAPTVDNAIAHQTATEDAAFSFQFASNTFADVDAGDTLTYTSDATGWLSFDAATRTFSGTPTNADVGTTTVTVTADDGNGGTISDTFDIVISNTNDAPTVDNAIADQTATEDSLFSFTFAANTFADVDGDTLSYTSDASGWLSFDAATRTFSGTPLNADVGTTMVTVTADDGNGSTVSDTFDIVVSNTNDAPTVATPISDQTATEDTAFSFQFAANAFNDVDGDTLTYTSGASGWLSFDAATRTFSGTPLNSDVGTTTVTVTANDGNGGTISDTFDIVISSTNDAPTVDNAIADQVATEDTPFSFQFATDVFGDVDAGDTLTYTSDASGWLSFDAATRTFSGTPLNADVGTTTVTVTANDGNGGTITDTFDIVISNTNDAPTVDNAIADQTATEDSLFSFQFAADVFGDVDAGDTLTYTSNASGWMSFDAATRTFSGTPLNADIGTTTVTVTADDGHGGTVSDSFDIVISNSNDAPTVATPIADQTATEDSAFTFTFDANTFADVDAGDSLTYTSDASGWLSFDAATRTFSGTPLNADVGTTTVTVTAVDGNGGTVSDTFDIVISNSNDAPTVDNAIADQTATEDAAFSFQFASNTFADVDAGDTLTYTSDATGWLSFDAATRTFSGTPTNADVGTTTVTVTADDGNGGTISDTFDIVISNTNDAPTVDNAIADQTATEDSLFSFTFAANTFADVDGDTLSYTSDASGWLSFDAATRTFSGTPLNADVGTTMVTVTADDGNGSTVSDTFDIVVSNTNDAPTVATPISDQTATEDTAFSFQFAANAFNDVDGDTLTYTSDASGWLSFDAATRTFSGTPLNSDVGTTTVTVTANDGNGGTISDTFDIVISSTNDAPTVDNAIADQVATEDTPFSFQFASNVFGDVDAGDTLTYTSNASGWLSFDAATRTFSGTPTNADVGTTTVTVTANDGNGGTVSDSFNIVISNTNDAPTITSDGGGPVANVFVAENTTLVTTVTATDVEDDTLSYSIIDGVDAALFSIDNNTGELSFIAPPDYETPTDQNTDNTYAVNVRVSDGNGGFDNQSLSVTVTDVVDTNNTPIVETTIPDQTLAEDFASYTINLNSSFVDVETADVDLNYSVSGNSNINVSITSGIATISNTANWNGSETLTFTAEDEGSATVSQTVLFTVNPDNDAPTGNVTISGISIEAQTLTAANTLADADGLGAVNYQWQRDGANIDGATAASYLVQGSDVAHNIRVVASYTDGDDSVETVSSAAIIPTAVVVEESIDEIATTIDPLDEEPAPIEEAPVEDQIQDDPTEETLVEDDLLYFEDDGALQEPTEEIEFIALDEDPHAELTEDVRDSVEELRAGDQRVQPEEDRSYSYFDNNLYKEVLSNSYLDFEYQAPENVIRLGEFDDFSSIDFESDNLERIVSQGDYDLLRQEIDQAFSDEVKAESVKTKLVTFTSTAFSVGIVSYLLRAGSFAASFASTLPLWRGFDPIVVFSGKKKQDKDENELPDTEEQTTDLFEGDEK